MPKMPKVNSNKMIQKRIAVVSQKRKYKNSERKEESVVLEIG